MPNAFDDWCRDARPLTFAEYLDELYGEWEETAPSSSIEQGLRPLYGECRRRITLGQRFAVSFVEIDHFREYSDRYGRDRGKRVAAMLSRILRDALRVRGCTDGFVVHLAGNDFILILGATQVVDVCSEICATFDDQVRLQYDAPELNPRGPSEKGRDVRLHGVPPMALSIGVVTNEERDLTHFSQFMELAMEMKKYARSLPGSVFVVDRRRESEQ